ncbi:MAG TPA: histidine kinase dimerization/phospho-acceptor domain-containing protein, partial [Verrucomicrobiae bacterium]|nr:histidine kinase dimerization/phospho-acceptor domain-containing protein [Verrucomicrobiae bacterium]
MSGAKSTQAIPLPPRRKYQTNPAPRPPSGMGGGPFVKWAAPVNHLVGRLVELLSIPAPDTQQTLRRIQIMELDIALPIKAAGIAMLLRYFILSSWIRETSGTLEVSLDAAHYFFWFYFGVSIAYAWLIVLMRRLKLATIEWAVFAMSLGDGIFLGVLTLVTGGYNSILYWLFLGLIARTAVSVPRAATQLVLNVTLSTCYLFAGVIDSLIYQRLEPTDRAILDLYGPPNPEPLVLRLALLLLMTFGCYAVQVLLERQRQSEEEARELAVREVQLRAAGRLAAEFAHQIKNPLAIINTAAFSLQRGLKEGKANQPAQVAMIQEEVERADRIITQVMGYAQLSEGHVERLNVVEELNAAINRVFPAAAGYPIKVHRQYASSFPPLLMQRHHASETFMNVLQNARDALETRGGNVW